MSKGIGRPRVEPSFVGQAIDRMLQVPDAASVGAMREAESVLWDLRPCRAAVRQFLVSGAWAAADSPAVDR